MAPTLLGIVNITEDSFSDGGLYLAPEAATARALALVRDGADIIDLGAASSNPRATAVEPDLEIARLAPVVAALQKQGVALSIDTFASPTQRWALTQDVAFLNDINGFRDLTIYPALAASGAKLIVMHALEAGPARVRQPAPSDIFDRILRFFERRVEELAQAGVAASRLVLDPGMGLFLGRGREASLTVLGRLPELKRAFGLPILVSVSRKSFLRAMTGRASPAEAGPASLAAELFAAHQGVDYIRTHDPGALKDALAVTRVLETAANTP